VSLSPGSLVAGDYRIVSPMAQGGMGEVYAVEQLSTGKRRALKLMKPELLSDPALVARFEQEAKIGARIESDHVVEVVGAGVDRELGMPWLAMELLQGESLAAMLLRRRTLPFGEARALFGQLSHGLGAAHKAGVVHRDLKPENIFIAKVQQLGVDFKVKILDFGIAKLFDDAKTSNTGMMSLGTPRYMAPEQTGGQPITPATDVWALGLIAFQVLTGHYYWRRATGGPNDSVMTLMREVLFEPLVPASRRAAEYNASHLLPPGFDEWFAHCVAREPIERFQNATDAQTALDPILRAAAGSATLLSGASRVQPTQPAAPAGPPGGMTVVGQGTPHGMMMGNPSPAIPHAPTRTAKAGGNGLVIGLIVGAALIVGAGVGGYYAFDGGSKDKKSKRDKDDDDGKKRRKKNQGDDDASPSAKTVTPPEPLPTAPTVAPPSVIDRSGNYTITRASNIGNPSSTYTGSVTMKTFGGGYRAVWSTGFVGAIIESDGVLVGNWGPDPHIAAIYKVDGGKLSGKYIEGAAGKVNSHTLEGPSGLNGSYKITASSENDTGTIIIRPEGQTYTLVATLPNESMLGTGILSGDQLAVGWSPSNTKTGGVIAYRVIGNALNGLWTFHRGKQTGTENLERAGQP